MNRSGFAIPGEAPVSRALPRRPRCCSMIRMKNSPGTDSLGRGALRQALHAERAALAEDLATLDGDQWAQPSLCASWNVEEVVAHLTAAASLGPLRWFASVGGARFDFDLHNARRVAQCRGATAGETLERFRQVINSNTSAPGPAAAWLGEVVVHGEDIRRPLGLRCTVPIDVLGALADFYSRTNFTLNSRSMITGLRLEATDGPWCTGDGPVVRGNTLALIMVMAGRMTPVDDLSGAGVSLLRARGG